MWLEIANFAHFLGLAFGLGGATTAFLVSRKAEKDAEVGKAAMKIIPSISKLIWLGMLLLIISGIAITFLVSWPINRQLLIVKHVLVAWIVIFGIFIGFKVRKMKSFSPKPKQAPSLEFIKAKKQLKTLSSINMLLWYLVTFLSVFV